MLHQINCCNFSCGAAWKEIPGDNKVRTTHVGWGKLAISPKLCCFVAIVALMVFLTFVVEVLGHIFQFKFGNDAELL